MSTKIAKKFKQKTLQLQVAASPKSATEEQNGAGRPQSPAACTTVGELTHTTDSMQTPVTNASLHNMLSGFQNTFKTDLQQVAAEIRADIQTMGERTARLEEQAEEIIDAHNGLSEAHTALCEKVQRLEAKIASTESGSAIKLHNEWQKRSRSTGTHSYNKKIQDT
ncbi:Hypothetical predicted protein [Pelobates cultripes]|uniref:Uncharacterized protein n=1 Tax=Pelobates cultripes TaxID=61616 RepID=A0AAD1SGC9_PELCU|nr:Hypothetical predicted protein [Pelobates cultripes]CAH2299771.1 Hypothetical predicted protein [Pelobates cultripes]